jgi:RNA polymerase sigma-70 factor, ECF subfamily
MMEARTPKPMSERVDSLYRTESRRIFATLVRLLGDFDLAEEALHEAFTAAVERWAQDGVPQNPCSWLISTGRFKAIDTLRRRTRFQSALPELAHQSEQDIAALDAANDEDVEDERVLEILCMAPLKYRKPLLQDLIYTKN